MKNNFKAALFLSLVFCAFVFAACSYSDNTVTVFSSDATQEETLNFISENLPVFAPKERLTGSMSARFYKGDAYVPYVGLRYYLSVYMKYSVVSESYSKGEYRYVIQDPNSGNKRYVIVVNKDDDTIYMPTFGDFQSMDPSEIVGFLSIVKTYTGEKSKTFDLAKYGFGAYGGIDDVYMPLCVLSNVFSMINYERYFYNGQAVYFTGTDDDYYDKDSGYASFYKSPWYTDSAGNLKERPQELISLSYNLLRFTHENLYGRSGYYGFADDGKGCPVKEKVAATDPLDFEQMLLQNAGDIRSLLLSSSYIDYIAGLDMLYNRVYGDAHSSFTAKQDYVSRAYIAAKYKPENLFSKKYALLIGRMQSYPEVRKNLKSGAASGASYIGNSSADSETPAFEVIDSNKTAIIRFDKFEYKEDFWKGYYASSRSGSPNPDPSAGGISIPDDTVGIFYKSFYALENDSRYKNFVKNVVIDLSCNPGGDTAALHYALCFLLDPKDAATLYYDFFTGGKKVEAGSADINLDGKIDDKDKKKNYNFVVLTSDATFSCGNSFANTCWDNGIKIAGIRSVGGSCVVRYACTADGFPFQYSGCLRESHKADWSSVEDGAPVEKTLTLDQMYDNTALASAVNELFPAP